MYSVLKLLLYASGIILCLVTIGECQELKHEKKEVFAERPRIFSFELLYFTGKELNDHLAISPYQIWSILTVLAQGTAGESHKQLTSALRLPRSEVLLLSGYKNLTQHITGSKNNGIDINTGNFIFFDSNFVLKNTFQKTVEINFDTTLVPLNFNDPNMAATTANDIISRATKGKILDALLSTDFTGAQMIMSNSIEFKGLWTTPFNISDTTKEPFYNENGVQIGEVNMMYQRSYFPFASIAKLQGSALELSYGENRGYSMLVILPYPGVKLVDMFKNFQQVDLSQILNRIDEDAIQFEGDELDCYIPRFKVTTDAVLNKPLIDMGISDIFDSSADLSRISEKPLVVSKVIQKTVLEVTESGTLASATASVVLPDRIEPLKVRADRPFVYLIIEKVTSTILFGGIYSKPSLF